jgi:hypothetical protein
MRLTHSRSLARSTSGVSRGIPIPAACHLPAGPRPVRGLGDAPLVLGDRWSSFLEIVVSRSRNVAGILPAQPGGGFLFDPFLRGRGDLQSELKQGAGDRSMFALASSGHPPSENKLSKGSRVVAARTGAARKVVHKKPSFLATPGSPVRWTPRAASLAHAVRYRSESIVEDTKTLESPRTRKTFWFVTFVTEVSLYSLL